jgi:hypothetical protein
MSSLQQTPRKDFFVHRGAPDPIIIRFRSGGANGILVAFDATLKFTYTSASGLVTLGVGSGITLSTDETVANARATIQLTIAQSRQIPDGALTSYELQRLIGSREEVFLNGFLVGSGGVNVDG